jgi:glutamyl-tRNA synthetase
MPDSPAQPVVTRFAPSPTGELHIGGARTALFAWAFARHHEGRFLLRFEDTDLARSSEASAKRIEEDLRWLGITWDNDTIPRQSQRLERYNAVVQQLLDAGKAYEDGDAVRFKHGTTTTFVDAVYGEITVPGDNCEDFIIRKGDAGGRMPTFHLAVVVDDYDFRTTRVIRGQEHLTNTVKHAALYDALGWPRPQWVHLPSIMNPGGSKMSKRDKAKTARTAAKALGWPAPGLNDPLLQAFLEGDNNDADITQRIATELQLKLPEIEVADFRRSGYLPEVICNYIALLGWNPGNDLERFSRETLVEKFSLDRINKANSTFDREKLAAFNQANLIAMPLGDFTKALREHFTAYHPSQLESLGEHFDTFAAIYQQRSRTLSDPATLGRFFFEAPSQYDDKAVKKNLNKNDGEGLKALSATREALAKVDPFDAQHVHAALDALWPTLPGAKNIGAVAQPLRLALTGSTVSPEIGPTLAVLGKEEVLLRIDACLAAVKA